MDITPELLIASVSVISALVAARQAHFSAKRELVAQLQAQVDRDQQRIEKLETERNEYADLHLAAEADRNLARDELLQLQRRATDTENRLARAEKRAADAESQENIFRQDVVQLRTELARERADSQTQINKLVIVIENLIQRMLQAGIDPGIDLEELKRMMVVNKGGA